MSSVIPSVEVIDTVGHKITIRKLTALDRMRLFEMLGASLSDNLSYMGYAMSASCVTKLDEEAILFPTTKRSIEVMVQRLGEEGLDAVARGYRENFTAGETGDLDAVKN